MRERYLGPTGLVVSELCLGTMSFGGPADEDASRAIVEQFREAGGNFFDTADVYTGGRSEELLGKILGPDREQVVIATKAYGATGKGANDRSSSRRHLVRAVDASLARLGTDWIDLYQLHRWDASTPLEETLSTLEDLVRAGKVLHVGMSNFVGWQIERAIRLQEQAGYDRFVALQPQYNLIERAIEWETLPAARANNLGILAWSPLAAGFLTGKYARGESGEGKGRFAQWLDRVSDQSWDTLELVQRAAEHHGCEPATVAVAWLLSQDVIPIIGATAPDQLPASLAAVDLDLDLELRLALDHVSLPEVGYPYDFAPISGRPDRPLL